MFSQLVLTFQSAAWIQLGKVKNPQSNKIEKDLTQAQYSIDMLDMLLSKTKGNLNEEEGKMLGNIVATLKMNYIEELEKSKKEKKTQKTNGNGKKSTKKES
jgi:F0F1-type ATP synthase membrane subunit b/b'